MNGMGVGGMEAVIAVEHWYVFWFAVWRARVALALWWSADCLTGEGGGNHPRRAEFTRRWSEFSAKLGGLRRELEALASEQQGAGYPSRRQEKKP
jgi:hypothetical protein